MAHQARPSYGLFLRHVKDISFVNLSLGFVTPSQPDDRPAIALTSAQSVHFEGLSVARDVVTSNGVLSPSAYIGYDVGLGQNVTGLTIEASPDILTGHLPQPREQDGICHTADPPQP